MMNPGFLENRVNLNLDLPGMVVQQHYKACAGKKGLLCIRECKRQAEFRGVFSMKQRRQNAADLAL